MSSDDPVVRDFFLSSKHADISGPWRPASIRDQSVRACLVVDRAIRNGWISKDLPLVIVGAGVAGVTAAVLARSHGIPVTIFERNKPLGVLSESSRWVDPLAYDWPHSWWTQGSFPVANAGWPISIEAGEARTIALQFADLLFRDPTIQLIPAEIREIRALVDSVPFGLVFDCRGVKAERLVHGPVAGPAFWDRRHPRMLAEQMAENLGRPLRVLISGGGDAAIQDFLLLATGVKSIVELAQTVGISTSPSPGSRIDLAVFEREALSIEERCWRELCWLDPRDAVSESRICGILDDFYRTNAERFGLSPLPCSPVSCEFTVVRLAGFHTICYPLNRLLGILADNQYRPRVLDRMPASFEGYDLVLIRHGVEIEKNSRFVARRQSLPFACALQ